MPTQKGQSPLVPPYILQLPYDISRQLDTLPRFIDREHVYLWLFISCLVVKHTTQLIKYRLFKLARYSITMQSNVFDQYKAYKNIIWTSLISLRLYSMFQK